MISVNSGQFKVRIVRIHFNSMVIDLAAIEVLLRTFPSVCALWYSLLESLAIKLINFDTLVQLFLSPYLHFFYNALQLLMMIVTATKSIDNGVPRVIFIELCFCCCSSKGKTIDAMPFDFKVIQSTIVSSNRKCESNRNSEKFSLDAAICCLCDKQKFPFEATVIDWFFWMANGNEMLIKKSIRTVCFCFGYISCSWFLRVNKSPNMMIAWIINWMTARIRNALSKLGAIFRFGNVNDRAFEFIYYNYNLLWCDHLTEILFVPEMIIHEMAKF